MLVNFIAIFTRKIVEIDGTYRRIWKELLQISGEA